MAGIEVPGGFLPNNYIPAALPKRTEDGKKPGKGKAVFRSSLKDALEEQETEAARAAAPESFSDEDLTRLLDGVHETGDRLKENPTIELVQAYKKSVRDFVHYIVERSFVVEEKNSGGNILKRKKYYRIAIVDESLERLAAEILRNQKDHLEILRRVDEINGILVDLLR
jgi:uncharacterized protein YaaR (DUF327 family)